MVAEEGDDYYDNFVLPKANSIVPVVTGGLSLIGSYIILREVFVDRHNNRGGKAIARLLTSLSIADVLWSGGFRHEYLCGTQRLGLYLGQHWQSADLYSTRISAVFGIHGPPRV